MCKACPALDFQKSHQLKQKRIIGQKGEIKLFLEVMIRRNFNSWGVRALITSKQTAQNILMATHQERKMLHYSPLRH